MVTTITPSPSAGVVYLVCIFSLYAGLSLAYFPNDWAAHNAEGRNGFNPLYPTYYRDLPEDNPRFKVEHQGAVLKKHVQALKDTRNKHVDIVFLVDSSASVGANNFRDELKFVKKLLSDFTVDENNTHVSLVTFSSRSKVIRHVDYISHPDRHQHKCSLLQQDLPRIRYTGGGTYTLGAFREAKKVLRNARKSATKAVFLVTDGFSNGGDPRPEARALREKGVKIFTFGIRNGNVKELHHMASEPKNETCYILDSFEEFEAMARRALHEDLHSGRYLLEKAGQCNSLCEARQDCCDPKSLCMCGTYTGKFQCVCPPGHYGSGLKGDCAPCPSGTYKPERLPGSDVTCLPCPDKNHVTEPGSTSPTDCTCKTGFQSVGEAKCAVLECSVLTPPANGYFVHDQCDRVFNAACGIRCHPGYELHGSSLRMCMENGSWTGIEPECRMKTCPPLVSPKNGNMICTRDDFSFKTICRFTCDEGYKLVGSRKRSCLAIAFWTGITTRCREITCPPLNEIKDGKILPKQCTEKEVWFGITCRMSCHVGYTLMGPHTKLCTPEGTWTPVSANHLNECVDTSAPLLFCPPDIETETDSEADVALITWQNPVAIDNSGYIPSISAVPAVISPAEFPMGVTVVNYTAEDLNKNRASCSLTVTVIDKEIPRIDRCVSPPSFITKAEYANVTWDEPIFSDNSLQEVTVTSSHSQGPFPHGETSVVYIATDKAGNNNTCTLKIHVKEHKCALPHAPDNGNYSCHEGPTTVECRLSCMEGYDFAMPAADLYHCVYEEGVWYPTDKMPFPDCSVGQVSKDATQPATVTYMGQVSCRERRIIHKMERDFENSVSKRVNDLCTENAVCNVDEVETTCEEDDDFNILTVKLERKKRAAPTKKRTFTTKSVKKVYKKPPPKKSINKPKDESIVTFDFMLEGSVDTTGNGTEDKKRQKALMTNLQTILKVLQEEAEAGLFDIKLGSRRLLYENMIFANKQPRLKCRQGSILKNNVCVFCPVGTFFNVVKETCESCGMGTYQPKQGTITCLVCPGNTSTPLNNSRSADECKAQCLPGSFSHDGLEMCETCDIGFYQPEYAQTGCIPCPENKTTVWRGKRTISDCRLKCQPGYVSKTGLEPCLPCPKGTYQSKVGMSACFRCPADGSTKRTGCSHLRDCEGDWDLQNDPQKKGGFGQTQLPQLPINPCFDTPCKNGGTCTFQPPFSFKCKCPSGYRGVICESEIDLCKAKPCLHGGSCTSKFNDYRCDCLPGFKGKKCERDIDECASSPCHSEATCVDLVNGFTCACPQGYTGVDCATDINECLPNPCLNNGECVDELGGHQCICADGYEGTLCEVNIDECAANPCKNNATCYDAANGVRCTCLPGFSGRTCDVDVDECASRPCQNGATCEDRVNDYFCRCVAGYGGKQCEDTLQSDFNLVFSKGGTTDYGRVKLRRDLTQFTVCFWMKTDDTENYGTPFSYATQGIDNAITITDYTGFSLNVNGENRTTDVKANDGKWHHICFTWSNTRGTFKIYRDGLPLDSGGGLATGQTINGGGFVVIGQEQDSYGGGFSERESFIGQLSGVNVWDVELSYPEIEDMLTNCEKVTLGNVLAWPDFLGSFKGQLEESESGFCKDCPVPQKPSYGQVEYTGTSSGDVASYSCLRGFELSGRDRRKCLVAGEWEDESPKCERVSCGSPGRLRNGFIDGRRYTFDSRVRYTCYLGYQLEGPKTRYCNEFGFWDGEQPKCIEITCQLPELSTNTRIKNPQNKYKPGDSVSFFCTPGNKLFTAHDTVLCQRDGTWDKSVPSCDSIQCGSPPKVPFGSVKNPNAEYLVGYICHFECDFGYRFSTSVQNTKGKIQCLASGKWETTLPICELVTCPEPPNVQNGVITGDDRNFLSQVRYSCDEGYKLSGASILECLETGIWDPPKQPSCEPVVCGRPPKVENGIARAISFKFKSSVSYTCKGGYSMAGERRLTCLANGTWGGSPPECLPPSCGPPQGIEHGSFTGDIFTYGSMVVYNCDVGYTIEGPERRVCRLDGDWQGNPPSCVLLECVAPPGIQNGYYEEASYFYKDVVQYKCENGYEISGVANLTCGENRTWLPDVPVCDPVLCPVPPDIENGNVSVGDLVYGSRANYQCADRFDIQGELVRICMADKTWSGLAPVCVPKECPPPLEILDGGYNFTDFSIGSTINYFCDKGFFMTGEVERECLDDLRWSYEQPRCDPVLCADPVPPIYGRVVVVSKLFQGAAMYTCDPGFVLVGAESRICTAETEWSGEIPYCKAVKCDSPARVISNGRMLGDNFTYQAVVRYECDPGYNIEGSTQRTCQEDGSWDAPIPVCEIVKCARPSRVKNGRYNGFVLDFNTTWEVTCKWGYTLVGGAQRTCLPNGTWSGPDPECIEINCGPLADIQFGSFYVNMSTFRGKVTYSCDLGYSIIGSETRVCQISGLWSGSDPLCEPIPCRDPNIQEQLGRTYEVNGTRFGDFIRFSCEAGYSLVGSQLIYCTGNGTWSPSVPHCEPLSCESPEPWVYEEQGTRILNGTKVGGYMSYSCNEGYILNGPEVVYCLEDRRWSDIPPSCDIVQCPAPPPVANGFVEWSNLTYGSEILHSCIAGFQLFGPERRLCLSTGIWSKTEPDCQLIECDALSPPTNGNVEVLSFLYESTASYECDPGFTLIGSASRSCLATGNWSNSDPFCETVQCPGVSSPDNGYVMISAYTYGTNITYVCNTGYELNGEETRECLPSGQWSGEAPVCDIISCPELPPVYHGTYLPTNFLYGETARFVCDAGFELHGDEEIVCLENKQWSGNTSPNCTHKECPNPGPLANGSFREGPYYQGDMIQFTCNEGFQIGKDQKSISFCTHNKTWQFPVPECIRVSCPLPSRIDDGSVIAEGYLYGDSIKYECYEGFVLNGDKLRVCQADKLWSGEAPRCVVVRCPLPPDIDNADIADMSGDTFGGLLIYNCSVGYKLIGIPERSCLQNGTWTEPEFQCVLVQCPELFSVMNGYVLAESFEYLSEIEFFCNSGFNLTGEAVLTCTDDGDWDWPIPTCQEISCPELGYLANGHIEGESTVMGSEVRFTCYDGYTREGPEILICQEKGNWNDIQPLCVGVFCPQPETVANGSLILQSNSTTFKFNDIILYECDEGYEMIGEEALVCLDSGQWSAEFPFCSQIQCPDLEPIQHGVYDGGSRTPGDVVNYSCDVGYELTGFSLRRCLSSGTWDVPAPNCDPILCRQPTELANGNLTVSSVFYGGVAEYVCEEGYELIGNKTRVCQQDKIWSGLEPFCHMLTCESPQVVSHSEVISNNYPFGTYAVGSYIEYVCHEGYVIQGNALLECLPDLTWSSAFPSCGELTCQAPEGYDDKGKTFSIGDYVEVHCPQGFRLVGEHFRTCLSNQSWSGAPPECIPEECQRIDSLPFGKVIGQSFSFNDTLSFACDEGYSLLGSAAIRCLPDGSWNDSSPTCFRVQCAKPRSLLNGGYSGSTFYAGDSVEFYCDPGYIILGYQESRCELDGTWSNDVPWCQQVECGIPPRVPFSFVNYPSTSPGSKAFYSCREGFELDGNNIVECGNEGSWIGELPRCVEIDCGSLPVIPHATTVITHGAVGTVAEYTCSVGYQAASNPRVECLPNGTWNLDGEVKCRPVDCGQPPSVLNARTIANSTTYGSSVDFECLPGFVSVGESSLICSEFGAWRGNLPKCKRQGCEPLPPMLPNVIASLSVDGLRVDYRCPENHRLVGASVMTCQADGTWSDIPPICEPEGCGDPPPSNDLNLIVTPDVHIVRYRCHNGYVLRGVASVVCLQGVWSDAPPTCEAIICQQPIRPKNGRMESVGQRVGQTVTFSCDPGYILAGQSRLICQEDGTWDANEPHCSQSEDLKRGRCTSTADIPGVETVPQGFGPGETVTLQCGPGHVVMGSLQVVCQDNLTWSTPPGQCQRIQCGRPVVSDPANVMLMGRSFYYGDRVVFMCRRGLLPVKAPSILRCKADGRWDGTAACVAQCKFECLNGGRCVGMNRCKCMTGYAGNRCQTPICILPCLHGGKCSAPYRCDCKPGYRGTRCQTAYLRHSQYSKQRNKSLV